MELQEYLDQQEQVNESFQIEDDQQANWALRKIKQHQKQMENNNATAKAEIERIKEWNQQENDKAQQSIDYFQGLLAKYALSKREKDPKFKSMNLPQGRLAFRKQQPKWNYDDKVLIESLKQANMSDFIRIKEEPDKSVIKKAFEVNDGKVINPDTGEIIEGITVTEQGEKFEVKVDDEK